MCRIALSQGKDNKQWNLSQNPKDVNVGLLGLPHFGADGSTTECTKPIVSDQNPKFKQEQTAIDGIERELDEQNLHLPVDEEAQKAAPNVIAPRADDATLAGVPQPLTSPFKQHPKASVLVIGRACDSRK